MAPSSASTICSDESSESARGSATHTLPGRRAASKTLSVVCVACSPEKPTSTSCKSTISSSSSIATTTPPENASASKHPMRYSFKEVLHFKREFTPRLALGMTGLEFCLAAGCLPVLRADNIFYLLSNFFPALAYRFHLG